MSNVRLPDIETEADLAEAFGCSLDDLSKITQASDQLAFYARILIPKRGRKQKGQHRVVYKPTMQALRLLQKNIATALSSYTEFDDCVQGFTAKRSIVTNARAHLGAKVLMHADIKDFFESIKLAAINEAFESLGCNPTVASALAKICSLNGFLPQGSSASPIIANMVCRSLDADLLALAAGSRSTYTRYADDMTFSGETVPNETALKHLFAKHGFEMRDGTCRTQKKGKAQYVTGLTVADVSSPHVARRAKHRLRLELHYIRKYGLADHLAHNGRPEPEHWAASRIEGWIRFLHSVEPARAKTFATQWEQRKDNPSTDQSGNG
jgi:retron-type reverse transcriptase